MPSRRNYQPTLFSVKNLLQVNHIYMKTIKQIEKELEDAESTLKVLDSDDVSWSSELFKSLEIKIKTLKWVLNK